jgi:hypothetical protein
MADLNNLIKSMQRIAKDSTLSELAANVLFGTVVSASPLKINVEQKMTLEAAQLVLTRNVTDYNVDMTVSHITELETEHFHAVQDTYTGGGTSSPTTHLHSYRGKKKFRVHNALKKGELVVLLRVQGGQKFVVLDRLEESPDVTNGQWLE